MNRFIIPGRVVMLAAIALLCFWRLGAGPLNETDEGFAANRASSFFRHGTFLVSFDDVNNDDPQFRKPPLLYWAVALCLKTLGVNLWAVRLPTAMMGFGCCVLFYLITRRHLGEWVAQLSSLALALLPFVLWHIRTAMLEMPLLFLVLLSIYLLVYAERRPWVPALAGLVAGSALLLKGGAGLLAPLSLPLFGLTLRRPFCSAWRDTLVALLASALPLALYLLLLTPEYREGFIQGAVLREGAGRISRVDLADRVDALAEPLLRNLRWLAPAAVGGLLVLLGGLWRQKAWRGWTLIGLTISIPVLLIGLKQVVPYPRYFLPVYPFVTAAAALFCLYAVRHRAVAWLLLPFAWWSWTLESTPLRWTPVLAAGLVFLKSLSGCLRAAGPIRQGVVAGLLYVAIVWPSVLSAREVGVWPIPNERPQPEVARLAAQARPLIPPGEKIIASMGFKYHSLLFYSQRAAVTHKWWLLHEFRPGSVRYAVLAGDPLEGIPGLRVEDVSRIGSWSLTRLTVDPAASDLLGVLLAEGDDRRRCAAALALLQVGYRPFARGLLITQVVARAETALPAGTARLAVPQATSDFVTLTPGEAVEWILTSPRAVSGVQLFPVKRQESMDEIRVEVWRADPGVWQVVQEVGPQPDTSLGVEQGHVVQVDRRALRVRFDPVTTDRVRLVKTGGHRSRLSKVTFLEAAGEGTP